MSAEAAPAGEPMSLRQEPALSFGRIADAWAQEAAGQGGGLERGEIVARLSAALRAGAFDEALDAGELYLQFRPDPIDGSGQDFDWLSLWTCDTDLDTGEPMAPTPMPRRHRADVATINILARLFGDRSDAASRNRAWLDMFEQAEIERGAFLSWIVATGITPPAFWCRRAEVPCPPVGKKRGRKPHKGESLVRVALENIANSQRANLLEWLKSKKVESLRRMVEQKLRSRQRIPDAELIAVPCRTKMLEIIRVWRSERLTMLAPKMGSGNSGGASP